VRLAYTVRKRGKLFWQPTKAMRALGFEAKALGEDGPAAQAEALKLYAAWQRAMSDRGKITDYPAGSFGAFFDRFKRTSTWAKKGLRTRDDYERAWKHVDTWRPSADKPTLSRTQINHIRTETCEALADHLERTVSPNERHRTIKWLKVLLADAVVRLRLGYPSPAGKLKNPQPKGRSAIWLAAEVEEMAAVAAMLGFDGMSIAIEVAWEAMFSPVDVRTLRPREMAQDGSGWYLDHARGKTGKQAYAALSDGLALRLNEYLAAQNRAEADETPIIRQRDGLAYRTKDTFAADFRDVREVAFPGDTRQFLDIRRSANVEADAAGADKKTMGELLSNGLADSKFLDETYTPPTVAKARDVAAQRIQGRAKLAGEVMRLRVTK
jgi:hypothetical protein